MGVFRVSQSCDRSLLRSIVRHHRLPLRRRPKIGLQTCSTKSVTTSAKWPAAARRSSTFKFRNPYVEDVHVASIRSSCGCTTPRTTQETLKTYEEAAIVAHFNTDTFLGQRSTTLTVTFDKPFYAEVQLHVSGYIRSDIVLNPASVDFGTLDVGQTVERTIDLSYAGRSDWQITGVKSGSSFVEGDVVETGRSGNQVKYQLNVRLKPGATTGFLREQVLLQTTDARHQNYRLTWKEKFPHPWR